MASAARHGGQYADGVRRVCLWVSAVLLGWAAREGVLSAAPDHGRMILPFVIVSLLVATVVTVSVVTTVEFLIPRSRPGKHRRSNVVSA